ncbi:MAG: hypothetical protein R3F11_03160 [Verrucomicrobiales bacterium]
MQQGDTTSIEWRADGFAGNVDIEISAAGAGGPFQAISLGEANDGAYDWFVDGGVFAPGSNYVIRVSASADCGHL